MLNCLLSHDKMPLKHSHATLTQLPAEQVPNDYGPIIKKAGRCQVHVHRQKGGERLLPIKKKKLIYFFLSHIKIMKLPLVCLIVFKGCFGQRCSRTHGNHC